MVALNYSGLALLFLLFLVHPTSSSTGDSQADARGFACPTWLGDYRAFHAQHRGSPNATYLVYHCDIHCNGAGDRIKGTLFLLRVAAKFGKVLLIKWDEPAELTRFLVPNAINWTLAGLDKQELLGGPPTKFDTELEVRVGKPGEALAEALAHGGALAEEFRATRIVRSKTNTPYTDPRYIHGDGVDPVQNRGNTSLYKELYYGRCLFNFLYQPSDQLLKHTDEAITRLYGAPRTSYLAWHWRTGGSVGEQKLGRTSTTQPLGQSRLAQLMCALTCADKLRQHNTTTVGAHTPLLMITDMNVLRQFISTGKLQGVIANNSTAFHLESKGGDIEDYMNIFVDIMLLARAECSIISHSGFSSLSVFASTSTCYIHINDCIQKEQAELFEGVVVRKDRMMLAGLGHRIDSALGPLLLR